MTTDFISRRAREISPFIVMEVLERAQAMEARGEHVVHMEIGEPDFNSPAAVKQSAVEAIGRNETKYTHSLGLPRLREAVADLHARTDGPEVDPAQVVITTGSSAGMLLAFSALIDPGDEVIMTNPCYPCYPNFVRLAGGLPVFAGTTAGRDWQLRAELIEELIGPKTKAVIINSPSNPAGMIIPRETMRQIARVCDEAGIVLISDEIYRGMVYEKDAPCVLEFTDRAVVINGFSKLYAMTGWRLGYLIVPPELVRPIQKLQQNLFIAAPTVSQQAALTAIEEAGPDVERMVAIYDERRRWLLPRLKELGFGIAAEPAGAFYVLVDARHLGPDSYALALEILEEAKVAVTPGCDFGDAAEGYIRFSYANSLDELKEGCRRIEEWLWTRKSKP